MKQGDFTFALVSKRSEESPTVQYTSTVHIIVGKLVYPSSVPTRAPTIQNQRYLVTLDILDKQFVFAHNPDHFIHYIILESSVCCLQHFWSTACMTSNVMASLDRSLCGVELKAWSISTWVYPMRRKLAKISSSRSRRTRQEMIKSIYLFFSSWQQLSSWTNKVLGRGTCLEASFKNLCTT